MALGENEFDIPALRNKYPKAYSLLIIGSRIQI